MSASREFETRLVRVVVEFRLINQRLVDLTDNDVDICNTVAKAFQCIEFTAFDIELSLFRYPIAKRHQRTLLRDFPGPNQ